MRRTKCAFYSKSTYKSEQDHFLGSRVRNEIKPEKINLLNQGSEPFGNERNWKRIAKAITKIKGEQKIFLKCVPDGFVGGNKTLK